MKKLNRLFALSLAMLMCVCLVFATSCKGNGDDTSSDAPISSEQGDYQKLDYEVFDMGGDTINILGFYSIFSTGDTANTERGVLTIERRKELETLYNVNFNMEVLAQQYIVSSEIDAAHMAGDVRADLFCCFANGMKGLANAGEVYPISDVIDITRPQWNDAVTEVSMKDGKAYFISPDPINIESLVTFKPKYLDTYGIENPYDLIKEGKWTTDKYVEIAEKITQLGASSGVYGHNAITTEPSLSHVLGLFGTEWVTQDEDGFYHSNLDDPKIIDALNWLVRLNKTAPPKTEGDAVNVFAFPANNTGMGNVSVSDPAREKEKYFCEAPLSQHTTEPPNLAQQANVRGMQSLLSEERAKQVGTIYSYYCEPLGGSEEEQDRITKAEWDARVYNPESAETILKYIERGATMHKWTFSGGGYGTIDKAITPAIENETGFASVLASIKPTLESILDEKNKELDR